MSQIIVRGWRVSLRIGYAAAKFGYAPPRLRALLVPTEDSTECHVAHSMGFVVARILIDVE